MVTMETTVDRAVGVLLVVDRVVAVQVEVVVVTECTRCFRSHLVKKVASVMRSLADQLEEIEGVK